MEATKRPLLSDDEIELPMPAAASEAQSSSRGNRRQLSDTSAPTAALPLVDEPSDDSDAGSPEPCAMTAARSAEDDRRCFICLMDGDADAPLMRCCSTCYAQTHRRCWREWRNNQRLTALRSRLLGLRMQTDHLLRCTICKSGTAMLEGEEGALQWMNSLLCGGSEAAGGVMDSIGPLLGAPARRESSDEDAQLEDLIDMRTCMALVAYLGVLVLVLLVACVLIVTQRYYAGDVVLCCIIALYELSILQIVALAVARRRGATLATLESGAGSSETRDIEGQRQARDLPIPHTV
mmetsp:Transcript_116517/g.323937  ORF Transcript_116517/g.323937 Transcript_116517/m.323937 type:complete len:293 (-) Transcript_116517:197-1075(-)